MPSAGRSAPSGSTRVAARTDPHAGDRADQDVARQQQVDVAADEVRERRRPTAAARRGRRRCRRRGCGVRRKTMISARAISAPLPAEVMPSTKPTRRRCATAATLWRALERRSCRARAPGRANSARPSDGDAGDQQRGADDRSAACRRSARRARPPAASSTQTPPSAPGTEPTASHMRQPMSTVPLRQVAPAADRLRDRAVGEVGADRRRPARCRRRGSAAASSASRRRCRSCRRGSRRRGRRR